MSTIIIQMLVPSLLNQTIALENPRTIVTWLWNTITYFFLLASGSGADLCYCCWYVRYFITANETAIRQISLLPGYTAVEHYSQQLQYVSQIRMPTWCSTHEFVPMTDPPVHNDTELSDLLIFMTILISNITSPKLLRLGVKIIAAWVKSFSRVAEEGTTPSNACKYLIRRWG